LNRGKEAVMAEKQAKCAHPGCECPVPTGSKYCSDYCESVGSRLSIITGSHFGANEESIACECGHSECAGSETVVAAG
jgi:hypothetical protein